MEAPFSSPSHPRPSNQTQPTYFTLSSSKSTNTTSSSAQPSSYSQPPQSQYQSAPAPAQHQQAQTQAAQHQQQPVAGSSDSGGTTPFLRDFNLVAEAAKRAQMAVLMRDMEAVGL
ncbi:hypothetical protein LOCC1_G001220 [Lachnellula occidentalis]|uniref:Thiol methyltransferase n=1 Tax=Lachnellula occidentalis TaxID=215460 RepID=A0A8H8S7Z5_9HELO|nr:hypothetical protein LOCC1_G001220 [Lachnellula occidentalis]